MNVYLKSLLATTVVLLLCGCSSGSSGGDDGPANDSPGRPDNFNFQIGQAYSAANESNTLDFIETEIGGAVSPLNAIDNVLSNNSVSIVYTFCEEANASYTPFLRQIEMCDEFTDLVFSHFLDPEADPDESIVVAAQFAVPAVIFVMYHEMGHAIDDLSGRNLGGNFESVADAIAVVLSVQTGQPNAALFGADFLSTVDPESFFDVHGSGQDRAGDILCWLIGSGSQLPDLLPGIAENFVNTGRDCVSEYANQYAFVQDILPGLSTIPLKGSVRNKSSQIPTTWFAAFDNKMAATLRGH